ncbi:MAG: GreA/GreB family elongation factor [Chthoniobacterales bacterium]
MSRAFVKEDVDPPERSRRPRRASGLPPGAANYITARGAQRLRHELDALRKEAGANQARINELQESLASVTVVDPDGDPESIAFGAKVTVRNRAGELRAYRIVGVDELDLYPETVSWISPTGKALLAAGPGGRVTLDGEIAEIVSVEYPAE